VKMGRVDDELEKFMAGIRAATCFRERMKVYAPTCHDKCMPAVEKLTERLDKVFGGSTVYDAEGRWFNPKTKEVEVEPVKVIEVAHHCTKEPEAKDAAEAIRDYAAEAKQYSISFDQGSFYIAETPELQKAYETLRKRIESIRELPEFL